MQNSGSHITHTYQHVLCPRFWCATRSHSVPTFQMLAWKKNYAFLLWLLLPQQLGTSTRSNEFISTTTAVSQESDTITILQTEDREIKSIRELLRSGYGPLKGDFFSGFMEHYQFKVYHPLNSVRATTMAV